MIAVTKSPGQRQDVAFYTVNKVQEVTVHHIQEHLQKQRSVKKEGIGPLFNYTMI